MKLFESGYNLILLINLKMIHEAYDLHLVIVPKSIQILIAHPILWGRFFTKSSTGTQMNSEWS